ncbi:hypothetical protein [Streptomyces formicae]|uniref:Uncharacterized protein n=1 Tax=Streptomyces formicae TaxID=1616117 RepID=A0ABY3WQL5_9ACTN|nr:hypothetical protein [Streptomyces formicae]UNM12830.1 hypothetical protein J4032_16075 [Streptomyces formicae]
MLAAEAVLIHLEEADVRAVFAMPGKRLPGALFALETASALMVDGQDSHDVLGKVPMRMRWRCDDPRAVRRREMESYRFSLYRLGDG